MFESVDALIAEYAELQEKLGDPAVHADPGRSKKLNRRFAELSKIIAAHEQKSSPVKMRPWQLRFPRSKRLSWRQPKHFVRS